MPFLLVVFVLLWLVHTCTFYRVVSWSSHLDQNGLNPPKGHEKLSRKMLSFFQCFKLLVSLEICARILGWGPLYYAITVFWENCLASLKQFSMATVIDESWLLRSVSCVMHRRLIRKEIQIYAHAWHAFAQKLQFDVKLQKPSLYADVTCCWFFKKLCLYCAIQMNSASWKTQKDA